VNARRRWSGDAEASEPLRHLHTQTVPGGPAFSLLPLHGSGGGGEDRARFLAGLHNRSAVALEVALEDLYATTLHVLPGALPGHTGWVRTLACDTGGGGDVYSAACNFLRVWRWPAEDKASVLPDHLHDVRMFTGDLLQVRAFDGAVYTSGADGALRSATVALLESRSLLTLQQEVVRLVPSATESCSALRAAAASRVRHRAPPGRAEADALEPRTSAGHGRCVRGRHNAACGRWRRG
jgi:hypothetical protein